MRTGGDVFCEANPIYLLERSRARKDDAVDVVLADAPRDELRVLRAEVEDEDGLDVRRHE